MTTIMKNLSITTILAAGAMLTACSGDTDYTQYVNVFIGTGGHGHTNPATVVPHGMIQPGPDTRIHGWDACSGYYFEDDSINGFAHTRLSGTGCADYGDFLLMPTVGKQDVSYRGEKNSNGPDRVAFASAFSHDNEVAVPGYYSVLLDRYNVKAEITSTARAAIHRYTFPASSESGIILDLDYNIQDQKTRSMQVEIVNDSTIRAYRRTDWWQYQHDLYFHAVFSKPFTYEIVRDTVDADNRKEPRCKVLMKFSTNDKEIVMVKTSISSCGYDGAEKNLKAEIPAWDFDGIRKAAHDEWNKVLGKIDIETEDADQRTIFYTGLYHANISPNLFQDIDGRYLGQDLKVHQGDVNDPYYTNFSLWDTHRALHPLYSIISPELNEAYIRILTRKGEEGGIVPKWDCGSNYTGCMIGYHYTSLVTDAYTKGYRNFDAEAALKAGMRCAEYDTTGITPTCPKFIYPVLMPKARHYKNTLGYVPCDKDNEAVAKALEYAYNDYCIAVLADSLGKKDIARKYYKFAKAYGHYFDSTVGFMRGRDSNGAWRTPFDPAHSNHRSDDYCEGNAYQWSWFAPHDVEGLIALYGGKEKFAEKLDALFNASSELKGEEVSADISGLIGQYAHGNEPSHHIIHLYNYAGKPWKTQELADKVMQTLYANAPDGLSGNEDCGQMSAWYILNSMGFYQVCAGSPTYSIGRPLFNKVTINLPDGKKFIIETENNSKKNKYVSTMELNGRQLLTPFFTHKDIVNGGILKLVMTDKRN